MIRRLVLVLTGAIVAALLTAAPAHAAELVLCEGDEIVDFNPGLLEFTPQQVDMKADGLYFGCESTESGLTAASYETTVEDIDGMSCVTVLAAEDDATDLHWNTGATSHFSFIVGITVVEGAMLIVYTGDITSGLFAGATATIEVEADEPDITQCLTTGVTEAFGLATLTITTAS
jgi:hypothetical protein